MPLPIGPEHVGWASLLWHLVEKVPRWLRVITTALRKDQRSDRDFADKLIKAQLEAEEENRKRDSERRLEDRLDEFERQLAEVRGRCGLADPSPPMPPRRPSRPELPPVDFDDEDTPPAGGNR